MKEKRTKTKWLNAIERGNNDGAKDRQNNNARSDKNAFQR